MSNLCEYPYWECGRDRLGVNTEYCYGHAVEMNGDNFEFGMVFSFPIALAFCLPLMVAGSGSIVAVIVTVVITQALLFGAMALYKSARRTKKMRENKNV